MKTHERFLLAGILELFFGPWLVSSEMQPLTAWGWFGSTLALIANGAES